MYILLFTFWGSLLHSREISSTTFCTVDTFDACVAVVPPLPHNSLNIILNKAPLTIVSE